MELPVREIARRMGCSRQLIYQLLPRGFADRRFERRLEHFLAENPEAVNSPAFGGMTFKEIAKRTGMSAVLVGRLWQTMELLDRQTQQLTKTEMWQRSYQRRKEKHAAACKDWRRRNPERARRLQRAADNRWKAKVLREETCVVCGRPFAWTNRRESHYRRRGGLIVCSRACSHTPEAYAARKHVTPSSKPHGATQRTTKTRASQTGARRAPQKV